MNDAPVYKETYYANAPITVRISTRLAKIERSPISSVAAGVLMALSCAALGWYARGFFTIAYDERLLMLVTIVACYVVASRRSER